MLASPVQNPDSVHPQTDSVVIDLPPAAAASQGVGSAPSSLNSMVNSHVAAEPCDLDLSWYLIHSYNYLAQIPDSPFEFLFGIDNPFPALWESLKDQSLFVTLMVLMTAVPILLFEAVGNFLLLPIRIPCMISTLIREHFCS